MFQRLLEKLLAVFKDGTAATLTLFKVMAPIVLAVRLLQEFDLISMLAKPLGPAMRLVGLPAEMGLVWATALLNNIYSAMIVFLSLLKDTPVTSRRPLCSASWCSSPTACPWSCPSPASPAPGCSSRL